MKVVVFTAILGDCDSLKPAPVGAARCVCFVTDPAAHADPKGWELIAHPAENPRREAWQLRAIPHRLFDDYDRVIWIDASFTLTDLPRLLKDAGAYPVSAIRHHARTSSYQEAKQLVKVGQSDAASVEKQVRYYRSQGYEPKHLSISCVILRDNSGAARKFSETWATEIAMYPGDNTQVSLDYSAWKHGLTIHGLKGTRHDNPYATHDHADHKRRRKPYDKPLQKLTTTTSEWRCDLGAAVKINLHGSEAVINPDQAKEFLK